MIDADPRPATGGRSHRVRKRSWLPKWRDDGALETVRAVVRSRRPTALTAVALAIVAAGAALAAPLLVRQLIIDIGAGQSPLAAATALAGLVLAGAAGSGLSSFLLGSVGERGIASIRTRLVLHVLRMPLPDVRRMGGGDLAARAVADTAHLRSLIDVGVTAVPVSALIVLVSLLFMGFLDWLLLLVVMVTFGATVAAMRSLLRTVRAGNTAQQSAIGQLTDAFVAALGSLVAIKALRAEQSASGPIATHARTAASAAITGLRAQSFIAPLVGLSQQVAIIAVLATSGARLASGDLHPGDFVAFLMYLFQMVTPLMTIASGMARLQAGLSAVDRIDEVLHRRTEEPGPAIEPRQQPTPHVLELRGVAVGYGSTDALRGVDLSVPARGITALVGASGAGKSTILGLFERLLVPRRGKVLLHGHDMTCWPLVAIRGRIAYVDQACTLLADTVRQNLIAGATNPPDEEALVAALREVDLVDAVATLPNGLDTRLGKADDMSGGQRQRLALARAVLSEAEVVLLDEPTSHLDGINEQRLLDVLRRLARERAVVVATHSAGIMAYADRVVVLKDGSVLATGQHNDLVVACPEYRGLLGAHDPDSAAGFGERLIQAHRAT